MKLGAVILIFAAMFIYTVVSVEMLHSKQVENAIEIQQVEQVIRQERLNREADNDLANCRLSNLESHTRNDCQWHLPKVSTY